MNLIKRDNNGRPADLGFSHHQLYSAGPEKEIMAASGEKLFLASPPTEKPYISHGLPFHQICAHHAANTFNASRIYIVVSSSISKTEHFKVLKTALGPRIVAVHCGIRLHTPWDDVLWVARELKETKPDLIITLGSGSITDSVKVAGFAYANGAYTTEDLEKLLATSNTAEEGKAADVKGCQIQVINVPTSLSGGEYTAFAGATDLRNNHKAIFRHKSMMADLVALDPDLCKSTPERIWLSSGVRAVDHCVEGICGMAPGATEEKRKLMEQSLGLLLPNLLATKQEPGNSEARLQAMLGVPPTLRSIDMGIGASHGIGHQLGPLGVGHGDTSCVMLPAVLKFNFLHGGPEVRALQRRVCDIFWSEMAVSEVLMGMGLTKDDSDAGDVVSAFVRALGMPRSLAAVGIGKEHFESLAEKALTNFCTQSNPVALGKNDVMEILNMAAEDLM